MTNKIKSPKVEVQISGSALNLNLICDSAQLNWNVGAPASAVFFDCRPAARPNFFEANGNPIAEEKAILQALKNDVQANVPIFVKARIDANLWEGVLSKASISRSKPSIATFAYYAEDYFSRLKKLTCRQYETSATPISNVTRNLGVDVPSQIAGLVSALKGSTGERLITIVEYLIENFTPNTGTLKGRTANVLNSTLSANRDVFKNVWQNWQDPAWLNATFSNAGGDENLKYNAFLGNTLLGSESLFDATNIILNIIGAIYSPAFKGGNGKFFEPGILENTFQLVTDSFSCDYQAGSSGGFFGQLVVVKPPTNEPTAFSRVTNAAENNDALRTIISYPEEASDTLPMVIEAPIFFKPSRTAADDNLDPAEENEAETASDEDSNPDTKTDNAIRDWAEAMFNIAKLGGNTFVCSASYDSYAEGIQRLPEPGQKALIALDGVNFVETTIMNISYSTKSIIFTLKGDYSDV